MDAAEGKIRAVREDGEDKSGLVKGQGEQNQGGDEGEQNQGGDEGEQNKIKADKMGQDPGGGDEGEQNMIKGDKMGQDPGGGDEGEQNMIKGDKMEQNQAQVSFGIPPLPPYLIYVNRVLIVINAWMLVGFMAVSMEYDEIHGHKSLNIRLGFLTAALILMVAVLLSIVSGAYDKRRGIVIRLTVASAILTIPVICGLLWSLSLVSFFGVFN